ncbi:TetR/AcrR family transcriptional regulator [Mycobacterium sp.]|uniref:TetR/AcrR family transcriptional regulator n=1 Tax=Mycobacterium sp. TaxID=1785 RepID=UPI003D6AEE27
MSKRRSRRPGAVPADIIQAALRSAERLGRDVADVPIVVIAHALGVSRSTLLRQLGGSRRALDEAIRDRGIDPGGRPPVRLRAVEAAAALISAGGVASATLEAIAAEADCSVHSLYAVFGGRDGLLHAVYDRYIPPLEMRSVISGSSAAGLTETVRTIYGSLAQLYLREPRVLPAVLAETLARPAGPGAGLLIEHGALRMIAVLGRWLDGEVAAGRIRDLPRALLIQQLISPISVHSIMRPGFVNFPQVALPDLQESCEVLADAFVHAVAVH